MLDQTRKSPATGKVNEALQINSTDIVTQFGDAMADAGLVTNEPIIPDGRLHRVHIEGHRRGSLNGAYVLHLDGRPAGWFQDLKSGVSSTWKAGGGRWEVDPATKAKIDADRARRLIETEARIAKKAAEARRIWGAAKPCTQHPYLALKGVRSYGLRVGNWQRWVQDGPEWRQITLKDSLLIPVVSPQGELVNLQAILAEPHPDLPGNKLFTGGKKKSCFFALGETPTETILICEGYATGASLHQHTGYMTVVAFDCGNLEPVARVVRQKHPKAKVILCADNDRHLPENPGLAHARRAALAIGGLVSAPSFEPGCDGTDWNDWYRLKETHAHG